MNITSINTYNNYNYFNNKNQRIITKPALLSDCFCGKKHTIDLTDELQYIKSFFEMPIDIEPSLGLVFEHFDEKFISVDLKDSQLEKAVRHFYSSSVNKEDRKKFCELAKQILEIDSDEGTWTPCTKEKDLDVKLDAMVNEIKKDGCIFNNEHYNVKYVWKSNPYKTLRCVLDHNINILIPQK